jgi:filamentous hemagglutinin family protein
MGSQMTGNNFKRKLLIAAVVSCFSSEVAWAVPTGASVISGRASISTSGSTMTVTNTPKAIINWASFGIAAGETVKFIQQSARSSVLNRVTGSDPSNILGALQSNGKVFLINPNGIMFGASSRVDVNGLVASTLNMSDADFLNGRMRFTADRAAPGSVSNAGNINTPTGGFVYIVAPQVENSGVISTPSGEAILAAGHSVELVDSTDPNLRVVVNAPTQDVNLSQIMTQSGGNIYNVLNSGKISANTAVVGKTGRVYLKSAGNIQTTATSVIEARGDATMDGGHIQAFADQDGIYRGRIDASGRNGGFIETSAANLDISGLQVETTALSPAGHGGTWLLDPFDFTIDSGNAYAIGSALYKGNDVTIDTSSSTFTANGSSFSGGATAGQGDINVDYNVTAYCDCSFSPSRGSLHLHAGGNINVNAYINVKGGNVDMNAGHDINITSGLFATNAGIHANVLNATAGNNITLQTSGEGTAELFADQEMTLTMGGHLYLKADSFTTARIEVSSPSTLYFNFPNLTSDGWSVDGVANALTGLSYDPYYGSGTGIFVNSGQAIQNTNFFVTYGGGGLSLIEPVLNPILDPDNPWVRDIMSLDEEDEDKIDDKDKPRQCNV